MKFIRKSIRLKIFSIVSMIVLLMVFISAVNVRMERQIGYAMERVTSRYIPAYGALARANLRLVEQTASLRTIMLSSSVGFNDDFIKNTQKEVLIKSGEFWEETRYFHELISLELKEKNSFANVVELARIDQKVMEIEAVQKNYENSFNTFFDFIQKGDLSVITALLPQMDDRRRNFNESFDGTRRMMLAATETAAKNTLKLQNQRHIFSIVLVSLVSVLALIFAWFITRSLVKPVRTLLDGTQSVINGRLNIELPVTTSDEIGHLTTAFNSMTSELYKGGRIREMFNKYIDPRIVKGLIDKPGISSYEGERQIMTILFSDIKGFSSLSEGLTPKTMVTIMNRYFTLMAEAVHENGGVIDKFIGDAVMAYWGPPFNSESEHAELACRAAISMNSKLLIFRSELPELLGLRRNVPEISIRIGIATGDVVVGNLGSEKTKNFTVIGDTVNFASRLEGVNKAYGTRILVSEETSDKVSHTMITREIDTIVVPGKDESKRVFEILGLKEQQPEKADQLSIRYAKALTAYRKKEWDNARKAFQECLLLHPDDPPSSVFLKRLDHYEQNPPGQNWEGIWVIKQK